MLRVGYFQWWYNHGFTVDVVEEEGERPQTNFWSNMFVEDAVLLDVAEARDQKASRILILWYIRICPVFRLSHTPPPLHPPPLSLSLSLALALSICLSLSLCFSLSLSLSLSLSHSLSLYLSLSLSLSLHIFNSRSPETACPWQGQRSLSTLPRTQSNIIIMPALQASFYEFPHGLVFKILPFSLSAIDNFN